METWIKELRDKPSLLPEVVDLIVEITRLEIQADRWKKALTEICNVRPPQGAVHTACIAGNALCEGV